MRSALRRLANAAAKPPPVKLSPYGNRYANVFQLGTGTQSKEMQLRAYSMSGTVFAIVNLLSSTAASPEWHLYKKQPVDARRRYSTAEVGDDNRVEVINHAALSLWTAPNPMQSGFAFREQANQAFELAGECFWVAEQEGTTFPTALWNVRPDRMEVVIGQDGNLAGWMYMGFDGTQVPLRLDQVIQEKVPDPMDPFRGMSPIASIMSNIQQQKYATDFQRNQFLNGAQPDGIISFPEGVEDIDYDEFVARWRESHMGISNAGRVGILEQGATWIPSTQTNRDLEYGNLRLANRDEIREAYRIHKHMLGTVDDVNRANAETAEDQFIADLEIPRLDRRKDTLNTKLLSLFGPTGASVEFDYEDPSLEHAELAVQELSLKAQAAVALITAGYEPHAVLETVGLPDMEVVEKATQSPMAPPGWVPEQAALPSASPKPQAKPDNEDDTLANLMRQVIGVNGHRYAGRN